MRDYRETLERWVRGRTGELACAIRAALRHNDYLEAQVKALKKASRDLRQVLDILDSIRSEE